MAQQILYVRSDKSNTLVTVVTTHTIYVTVDVNDCLRNLIVSYYAIAL